MPSGSGGATRAPGRRRPAPGFTLLELIIVVAVIGILATLALPALRPLPRRANEAVLKTNLRTIRDVIDQYYGDRGRYPAELEALVEEEYLRKIPEDPMTKSSETWVLVYEGDEDDDEDGSFDAGAFDDPLLDDEERGIVDVHSGSEMISSDGQPYSEW